jgi:hypothetical protein
MYTFSCIFQFSYNPNPYPCRISSHNMRRLGKNIWLLSDLNVTRTEIRHWNQETPTHSFTYK